MAATPKVTYLSGTEQITPAPMNQLVGYFDAKLDRILGGRSFVLAFPITATIPPQLFGKTFFFTSGLACYAQRIPGYVAKNYTVPDPVNGGNVTAVGALAYDHSYFTTAAALPIINLNPLDGVPVARLADIPQASYPPGLNKVAGLSIFEQSLQAHTRTVSSVEYYIYEDATAYPEKIYNYALADIIIEGVSSVTIPLTWNKYKHFRFHNLQKAPCTVSVHGTTFTLEAFECRSFRSGYTLAAGAFRYFFKYQNDDPRCFWYLSSYPLNGVAQRTDTALSATAGMQGNNLSNPCVVVDFIQALSWTHQTTPLAYFFKDIHELCDLQTVIPDYAAKYGNASSDATLFGDMIHHKGRLDIAKVATDGRYDLPGVPLCTFDSVDFRGYGTIVTDLAAKGIKVGVSANGNLTLQTDPLGADVGHNAVSVLPTGTNMLMQHGQDNGNTNNDYNFSEPPLGYNIDSPRTLDNAFALEHNINYQPSQSDGAPSSQSQNAYGDRVFVVRRRASYKIFQRTVTNTARTSGYRDVDGNNAVLAGLAGRAIALLTTAAQLVLSSFHAVTLGTVKALRYFGDGSKATQDDISVQYINKRFTLTPEGLVLTFTEQVRADVINVVNGTSWYSYSNLATSETRYAYNATTNRFEAKHCIRFRKQGFGWHQWGKLYAAFYSPNIGRPIVAGYTGERVAAGGADFGFPDQQARETGIKAIRQYVPDILIQLYGQSTGAVVRALMGERFYKANQNANWDLLVHFDQICRGSSLWYYSLIGGNTANDPGQGTPVNLTSQRFPTALPLCAEHFNFFAQAVNQLKEGRPLDFQCLRFAVGNRVLNMNFPTAGNESLSTVQRWEYVFNGIPAPMDAFVGLVGPQLADWTYLFGQLGIPIHVGLEGLPTQFTEFYNGFNQWRSVTESSNASITNLPPPRTVTVSVSFTLNAPQDDVGTAPTPLDTALPQGFVIPAFETTYTPPSSRAGILPIAIGGNGLGGNAIHLRTAYNSVRWVAASDFKAWCDSIGFKFLLIETAVPLTLDWFELPETLEATPFMTNHPSFAMGVTNFRNANQADSNFTRTYLPGASGNLSAKCAYSKLMVFRLAQTEVEAFWKMPTGAVLAPPQIRNFDCRTPGTISRFVWRLYAWFQFNSSAGLSVNSDVIVNWNDTNNLVSGPATDRKYGSKRDWFPTGYENITAAGIEHLDTTGAFLYLQFQAPTDPEKLRRVENYYAWLEREQFWVFSRIIASTALGTVSQEYQFIPQRVFAPVKNWWKLNQDQNFQNLFIGAGFKHPLFNGPAAPPTAANLNITPERDVISVARKVTATSDGANPAAPGVTLLKPNTDEAFQVLYDQAQLSVVL